MKFVFVCPNIQFLRIQYKDFASDIDTDLVSIGGVRKIVKFANSRMELYKYRWFQKIVKVFLKKYFSKMKFNQTDDKICFVLYSRTYEDFRKTIVHYLKSRYKDCVVCVYYGDLSYRHLFDVNEVKKEVDFVLSFDEKESEKYGLFYLLEPFSLSIRDMSELRTKDCSSIKDISFVGHAKNRLKKILDIYSFFASNGISSEVYISGTKKKERKFKKDIKYKKIDFLSLLNSVVNSRCILEVMQNDGVSPTTRFAEAIVLDRYLLTDCIYFKNNKFANVIYYENVQDLSLIDFSVLLKKPAIDPADIEMFSVRKMIQSLQTIVSED